MNRYRGGEAEVVLLIEYDDMRYLINMIFHPIYEFVAFAYQNIHELEHAK
jgi:hypothetical protein